MAVMIGHNSSIGVAGSLLNEGDNDRSRGFRDPEIAEPMECADAKISHQHQEG